MSAAERTGICIIGGGPAGSSLAIRLAQLGHQVCLVERARFPRRHLGESLSPGVWPQIDELGARSAIVTAGFLVWRYGFVRWQRNDVERRDFGGWPGLIVDRGAFDALLRERVRALGVRMLQPAILRERKRHDRGWRLRVQAGDREIAIEARFLADASGRANALRGERRPTGMRTLALYANWRARTPPPAPRIEAGEREWCWGMPLPDGTCNAIVFLDPDRLQGEPGPTLYERLIRTSGLFEGCGEAHLASRVRAADATSYLADDGIAADRIRVGEAALALDPLSSSGVEASMQTGLAGAIVVNTLLRQPQVAQTAQDFYQHSLQEASQRHHRWAANFYRAAANRRHDRFWQLRAAVGDEAGWQPTSDLAKPMLGRPITLSPLAELVELPCIVGNFVAVNPVLRHPALERPVAFLDGIELAPLLRQVRAGVTPEQLIGDWSAALPPAKAAAIARFLLGRRILVPEGAGHVNRRPELDPPIASPTDVTGICRVAGGAGRPRSP